MAIVQLQVREHHGLNGMGFGVQHFAAYRRGAPFLHTHDTVEMNYVVSGCGEHLLGDRSFPIRPGALGICHYTQTHDIITGEKPMEVINLYLDLQVLRLPDLGEELSAALYSILPMHPSLRHRCKRFVHLQFDPAGQPESLLRAMLAEQQRGAGGYREALRALLTLFLVECARAVLSRGDHAGITEVHESEAQVERLRRSLDADPAIAVTLGELAGRVGWSPAHLCRMFHRHVGMSLMTYLQHQRVQAAMVRLRSGSDPVTAIALSCGFTDPSFFARCFRAQVGSTPSAYRQRFLGAPNGNAGSSALVASGRESGDQG